MAPSTRFIGDAFREELAKKIHALPVFIRPQLAPILGLLLEWVEHTEGRLDALEADFPLLDETTPAAAVTVESLAVETAARIQGHIAIQAHIDRTCGNCDV